MITIILNLLKTLFGSIYPSLKKKYFDQPKIYIRLTGDGSSFRPEFANDELSKNPENRLQIVYASCERQLSLLNNSEHTAYNLKLLTDFDKNKFILSPNIDSFMPLLTNIEITYCLKFSYTFKRFEREGKSEYPTPDEIDKLWLTLEYTNVKGTKFYTIFDNSLNQQQKNTFKKKHQ